MQAKGGRAGIQAAALPAPDRQHNGRRRCQSGLPHPGGQPHLLLVSSAPAQQASFLENTSVCMGLRVQLCHLSSTVAGSCNVGLSLSSGQ